MQAKTAGRAQALVLGLILGFWGFFWNIPLATGLELVMALDVSGSMRQNDPRNLLPQGARILINLARSQDKVGFLTFEDGAWIRLPLENMTPAHQKLAIKELKKLAPRGLFTNLCAALAEGLKAFSPEDNTAKRALLLFTDGQMDINPQSGDTPKFLEQLRQELVPQYEQRKIPIYTVAFTDQSDKALLKEIADRTKGQFLVVNEAQDLHRAFATIYEGLEHPQLAPITDATFLIDASVQEATVILSRARLGAAGTLIDPQGKKLTFKTVRPPIRWYAADAFDMVTIPSPEPGTWRLAGHKEVGNRIILLTDLKISCPYLPYEAGLDEELLFAAGLEQAGKLVAEKTILETTTFTAKLFNPEFQKSFSIVLGEPAPGLPGSWPKGLRVGNLQCPGTLGTWDVQMMAQGKTFQREQHFSLKIIPPWFDPQGPIAGSQGQVIIDYKVAANRPAKDLGGWVGITEPSGLIQAIQVQPETATDFQFPFIPGDAGTYQIGLQLSGLTGTGRPLLIRPAPFPVNITAPLRKEPSAPGPPPEKSESPQVHETPEAPPLAKKPKFSFQKWHIFGLVGLLALAILGYLGWRWKMHQEPQKVESLMEQDAGSGPDPQLENLKIQLQKAMAENEKLRQQIMNLQAQKSAGEPVQQLEPQEGGAKIQEQNKVIRELREQLAKAEEDAKSMQEEYMALYSRTQEEKSVLKKG
jgi:uncharacterized protein (TIGR03503 family)